MLFHPSIAKAAVAPTPRPQGREEATRIPQTCVVAWPSVARHGGGLAKGFNLYPQPPLCTPLPTLEGGGPARN